MLLDMLAICTSTLDHASVTDMHVDTRHACCTQTFHHPPIIGWHRPCVRILAPTERDSPLALDVIERLEKIERGAAAITHVPHGDTATEHGSLPCSVRHGPYAISPICHKPYA